jgi:hypothetical protein
MRRLLFTASVLVLLAGIQLFVFTGRTDHFFAWTIANPLAAAFLGAAYWAAVPIEALAARQPLWANARIAVPAVFVFTVLTLAATLTHLGRLHLGAGFAIGTQIITVAWIAIYVLVPALMLILLLRQARTPGLDPPRTAGLPAWLYAVLAVQAVVLLGLGIALFAAPGAAAPLWPWALTPMMAQATGAWLISLGVAAGQALAERDARRLRPAAAGSVLLAVLLSVALARYPHLFHWGSATGITYLIFLATMLLTGAASLARGLPRAARQSTSDRLTPGRPREKQDNRNLNFSLTTRHRPKRPLPPHLHHPRRAGREGFRWGWVWPDRGRRPAPQAKPAKDAQPQRSHGRILEPVPSGADGLLA